MIRYGFGSILYLLFLTGCMVSRPMVEETTPVSFSVTMEARTPSLITLRCTLQYPPRAHNGSIWSANALKITSPSEPNQILPFTMRESFEDGWGTHETQTTSRFFLSPIVVQRRTTGQFCTAQAVIVVAAVPLKDAKSIIVSYDALAILGLKEKCEQEIQLNQ